MKKFLYEARSLVKNLFYPPRCVSCRALIQKDILDVCDTPYCEKCRRAWELEKLDRCPDCGLEMTVCNCGAPLLKNSGVARYVKLINYFVKRNGVGKRTVLYLKRHKNDRAFRFLATNLSHSLKPKLLQLSEGGRAVVAYVPRGKRAKALYGFDQSEQLAKNLAKILGIELVRLFGRSRKRTKEQKKLRLAERKANAADSFCLKKGAKEKLDGVELVFLVDDILTSGASLYGCLATLKPVYANNTICVTAARTPKKNKA